MGFTCTFLPDGQQHDVGEREADWLSGGLHRGPMWRCDEESAGDLALTPFQRLPPGPFQALVQLFHDGSPGQRVGAIVVEDDALRVLGELPLVSQAPAPDGWFREALTFDAGEAPVRLRVRADRGAALGSGAIHLVRGARRPVWVIGHNRNTPEQVDRSLALGANAIEVDIGHRDGKIRCAEDPLLPNWTETSDPVEWFAHARALADRWAFLYLDCKPRAVPDGDFYGFGREIARLLAAADIEPHRILWSVPDPTARDLFRGAVDGGYGASAFGMDAIAGNSPLSHPPSSWVEGAAAERLDVLGMGRSPLEELWKPLIEWFPVVEAVTNARDQHGLPGGLIFWSLADEEPMRKMLDLGVDGLIVDREDVLCAVLDEEPYRRVVRRGGLADWNPSLHRASASVR